MRTLSNFIDGQSVPPAGGQYLEKIEPATGLAIARVPASDAADIENAVAAAARAFPAWAQAPAAERSRILLRLADLIDRDLEPLARAESIDTGKPIALARRLDIPRSAANLRFFASAVLHGSAPLHTGVAGFNYTLRSPRGVAGLISPWNLPLYLLTWKIAPALATGNTAVCKPSELTPTTASMLAQLAREAGLPAGVLNVVHGLGAQAGAALVAHPQVPTVSFTGGTATGRAIASVTAPMFKRVALELGGKNAAVVFADAELDKAVASLLDASFTNQGQICLCASRILVEERLFGAFVEKFVAGAKARTIGDPFEETTTLGALISDAHARKVDSYVTLARDSGGVVRCGGKKAAAPSPRCAGGFFYEPTVITGLPMGCRVQQEEIFGPVVTISSFQDEAEGIALANQSPYGLAAVVWTGDAARAHRVSAAIEAGIVWVNCWMVRDLRTPFGGMKQSGVGREGGEEALRFFTEAKNVCIGT